MDSFSKTVFRKLSFIFFSLLFTPGGVHSASLEIAQNQSEPVLIGTRVAPPFVIKEGDHYSGLSVRLWNHIASEMNLEYRFDETDIEGMLEGVADGKYYAATSAITITSEREHIVDFTHPFFVSGLGIAVSYQPAGIWQSITAIFSPDFWWVIFLLLLLLLFWGVLIWFFERFENQDEFGGTTTEGIGSGFWWAAVTMTTVGYGDKSPRTFGGRVVGFIWMFTAIIVISFFTASIASSLTVNQLESQVDGPEDLPDVRVGTLVNSATEIYLEGGGIWPATYSSIQDGLEAVENKEIDAFVHDAPIIGYYIQKEFQNRVRMLPNTFDRQYYGIALPVESPVRDRMNKIILDYINSEEWQLLKSEYLGD